MGTENHNADYKMSILLDEVKGWQRIGEAKDFKFTEQEEEFMQKLDCNWIPMPMSKYIPSVKDVCNNKMKEKENMFNLGDVRVEKDELANVSDGEVLILCPGYVAGDFIVNNKGCHVAVLVCKDDGETDEFEFEFNHDYSVNKVSYNVRNGVFYLVAEYDLSSNVELDDTL
jgi:hypothetical protein